MNNVIGFIKPNYPGEKRVALLPADIYKNINKLAYDSIFIESGFGEHLGIKDSEYERVGCKILSREEIFSTSTIFSLKLIQESDYDKLIQGQNLIGWMHPLGSGYNFCHEVARGLNIKIFDIDSVYPRVYFPTGKVLEINYLPKHFLWENSYIAGIASTRIGLDAFNFNFEEPKRVAILGSGSVSQGAFCEISRRGVEPRMFYRKTLDIFRENIFEFDLIINGIEVDHEGIHILDTQAIEKMKPDALIIDAAADAGRAIEGTIYQSFERPIGYINKRAYVLVNNAPSIMFERASSVISKFVAEHILCKNFF